MTRIASKSVARQLESLFEGGSVAGLSDRQLLERFNEGAGQPRGEAAFAALVGRHGPMVLGVCRQLLGDVHHAEDAFQAVFLVLAQKARSLREPDLLGNWLYGVAIRTARCAQQKIARRRKREERDTMSGPGAGLDMADGAAPPADQATIDSEQAEAVHREVNRLPRAFRLAVVLCYFEGLTLDEAARRLRCPEGTLRSRLARARDKLRLGLTRRGVALPAAALAAVLAPRSASASLSPLLCETTTRAATAYVVHHATGGALSATAGTLAREVLRSMLLYRLKLVAMTILGLAAIATGAGLVTRSLAMKDDDMKNPTKTGAVGRESPDAGRVAARQADGRSPELALARTEPRPLDSEPPRAGRMTVAGRVLDPDGKPVEGAVVELIESARTPRVAASEEIDRYHVLGECRSEGDGRFRFDAPRTSSGRVYEMGVVAAAPGYGLGWVSLNPDAEEPVGEIRLSPEQTVRIRLVGLTGEPAKGVEVRVLSLSQLDERGRPSWIGTGRSRSAGLRSWPRPLTTDDQGRIAISGLGRFVTMSLGVSDARYAQQDYYVEAVHLAAGKEMTIALEPARTLAGRVFAADTGRPIPNAIVSATTRVHNEHANGYFTAKFRADATGHFTMNPIAGELYTVGAFPPSGEPYLIQQDKLDWTKGAVKATHDIRVRRGVLIRGKVTDAATGRPLPASSIQFIPVGGDDGVLSGWQAIVASDEDGLFQIAVSPGKGHLLVFGPTGDYVLQEIGSSRLYSDRPGGRRIRAHAIIPYEVKAGDPPHEVAATLRPGVAITGRVLGPDGQAITEASVITTLYIEPINPSWRGDFQLPVREGRFMVRGLGPEASARIHLLDSEHEWGATVEISGNQAGKDLTIRLQPCGKALARFVGPDGKPVAGHQPHIEFVATPGPREFSRNKHDRAAILADAEFAGNVDRKHYSPDRRTDSAGRFSMVALIPDALYRIIDFSSANDAEGPRVRKEFSVKAAETLDLGDILIEKPAAP